MNEVDLAVLDRATKKVIRIFPELIEWLKANKPDYVPLYLQRYEYALGNYPPAMRMHNIHEILKMYEFVKAYEEVRLQNVR